MCPLFLSPSLVFRQRGQEAVRAAFSEGRGGAEAAEGEGTSGGAQPGESTVSLVKVQGRILLYSIQRCNIKEPSQ